MSRAFGIDGRNPRDTKSRCSQENRACEFRCEIRRELYFKVRLGTKSKAALLFDEPCGMYGIVSALRVAFTGLNANKAFRLVV